MNKGHFSQIEIELPPLDEQRSIASVLGALDDKIELNRRMNGTLEAMAQALFKEWFVDGAKEEWEDEIADYRNGLALQRFRPKEGEVPLPAVKIAQMRTGLPDSGEWASPSIDPECILEDGDVVFSWSGSLMAIQWCGGRAALNQHLFKVTSKKYPKWFYFLWTQQHMPEFQMVASNKATTMGHINRHHLKVPVSIPPAELMKRGDQVIAPLLDRIVANNLESRTLAALRDTLLPKLMRGEVRVKEPNTVTG
ncbi:MAG TPA: restriction endonuclease subunit S [Flavobacteriales bacterium]|nr:restriction endonuclease subunit S [Flavobacteriales bacterium]